MTRLLFHYTVLRATGRQTKTQNQPKNLFPLQARKSLNNKQLYAWSWVCVCVTPANRTGVPEPEGGGGRKPPSYLPVRDQPRDPRP